MKILYKLEVIDEDSGAIIYTGEAGSEESLIESDLRKAEHSIKDFAEAFALEMEENRVRDEQSDLDAFIDNAVDEGVLSVFEAENMSQEEKEAWREKHDIDPN